MGSEFAEKSIAEWYVSLNMYTMIDDDKIFKRIPIETFYPKEDRCWECKLEI